MNGESKQRSFAADLLARLGEQNRDILQQAADSEKLKSVQVLIIAALQRFESLQQVVEVDYTLPEIQAIETQEIPESFIPIIVENYEALLEKLDSVLSRKLKITKPHLIKVLGRRITIKICKKLKIEQISQQLFSTINTRKNPDTRSSLLS